MEKYIYRAKLDRVVDGDTVDALIDVGFDIWVKKRIRFMGLRIFEDNSNSRGLLPHRACYHQTDVQSLISRPSVYSEKALHGE